MPLNKPRLVITDASCLIVLNNIGRLDLLPQLFEVVITTPEIAIEFGEIIPKWLAIIAVTNHLFEDELKLIVDAGEASAIALAHEIKVTYLITDDLKARKLATKLGLKVIGTLGVLLKAKQVGLIDLLKPVFEEIGHTNFRITSQLMEGLLRDAGE